MVAYYWQCIVQLTIWVFTSYNKGGNSRFPTLIARMYGQTCSLWCDSKITDFYEILSLLTQSQFNHREFHIPTHPYITDQLRVDFSIQSSIPDQIYNPLFSIIWWHVQFVSQHTAKIKHIYSSIDINTMQVRNKLNYMEWFLYLGYRHMPCTEFTIRKYQIGN